MKRLYRSKKNRILGGVLGGVAEIYGLDPSALRIIYAFVTIMTGFVPFGLLYLVAWGVIPEEGSENRVEEANRGPI